jgi:hypothetical protein
MANQAVASGRRVSGNSVGTAKYIGRKVWVVLNNAGKVVSAGWN